MALIADGHAVQWRMELVMHISRRMLIPEGKTSEDVFELADAIDAEMVEDLAHPIENGIIREVTWRMFPGVFLQFAEDIRSLSSFVVVAGDSGEEVSHYAARVASYLGAPTFDELFEVANRDERQTLDERYRAILRLGIGAPAVVDMRLVNFLHERISNPIPNIRAAVIFSMRYAFWREFQPLLRKIVDVESDPGLREEALIMLEASVDQYGNWDGGLE